MGYQKKTWKDRISQYPNRRIITDENGMAKTVTVSRAEGTVTQEGDPFNATLMNDLENRISNAFSQGGGGGSASILYGTTAPSSSQGENGNLYVQYTEGTGGADDTVDALFVMLDDAWCEISTGGGGGASSADHVSFDDTNVAFEADDVQEAFENITKSLTWAEYEDLSSAEKNNGTIYLITDVTGGNSANYHIYSASEQIVGKWIDGSTLYERTFNLNNRDYGNNSWSNNILGTTGIEIINFEGFYCINQNNTRYPIGAFYRASTTAASVCTNTDLTDLNFFNNMGFIVNRVCITIRYIKTN